MTPPYALSFFRAVTIPSGTQWCNDTHRLAHALSAATRRLRIVILQSGNDTERAVRPQGIGIIMIAGGNHSLVQ